MNTTDLLTTWSTLSLDEIAARLASGQDAAAAEQLFGPETAGELVAAAPLPATRSTGPRERVVLLPGIMGSLLASIRGVTTLLWINPAIFLQGNANYLELNAEGAADLNPAIEAVPVGIEKLVYLKIALALRREFELFEFPYDWRRPIEVNADTLAGCLARWAAAEPDRKFTLVGHSMGGVVARAFLARHPATADRLVQRAISLGTPYFGATNAIENIVLGNEMMALAAKLNRANETKRLLLNMPSLYEILPAPPELFPASREYAANWDLYDAAEWRWAGIRPDYLALARRFHALLAGADPQIETVQIAGCHLDTTVDVRRVFDADERVRFEVVRREQGPDSGDGTVPLWSAVLPKARMFYVQEQHRYLPCNEDVIAAVSALIQGDAPALPDQLPPRKSGLFRSAVATPDEFDAEAEALRQRLADGTASEEDLAQLYFA